MAETGTPTLMETLKDAVRESHARMEAIPFFAALTGNDLPLASVDLTQARHALLNLVFNASEALGIRGGEITIRTYMRSFNGAEPESKGLKGAFVCLEVRDTGPGTPPDLLEKSFDPLFSSLNPGRGLGLSTVQGILQEHQGAVLAPAQRHLRAQIENPAFIAECLCPIRIYRCNRRAIERVVGHLPVEVAGQADARFALRYLLLRVVLPEELIAAVIMRRMVSVVDHIVEARHDILRALVRSERKCGRRRHGDVMLSDVHRRTLLVATAPLTIAEGGRALIDAISSLVRADVAFVLPGTGERALVDEIKRIAIETPGKIAIYPETGPSAERQILAGADVLLLADKDNHLARTAGTAMRYATLPLVPDCAAYADYMVDYDVASHTGNGLLYQPNDPYEQVSVVLRAAGLRGNPDVWQPLQDRLMRAAPHWAATAALFEGLFISQPASV